MAKEIKVSAPHIKPATLEFYETRAELFRLAREMIMSIKDAGDITVVDKIIATARAGKAHQKHVKTHVTAKYGRRKFRKRLE